MGVKTTEAKGHKGLHGESGSALGWLCTKVLNPTHGSGWFIQMLSTRSLHRSVGIPPTAVGGLFKSLLRKDLKYPPIAMGGI